MKILVTGGTGYIGSITAALLLENNHEIVLLDNLSNSSINSFKKLYEKYSNNVSFENIDLKDFSGLKNIFSKFHFDSVIHFGGLKAVQESVVKPEIYYMNNVIGTINLLNCMHESEIFTFVFSSSATVYGQPNKMPIPETSPSQMPSSPYGKTKLLIEELLKDFCKSDNRWKVAILRYFNPLGACLDLNLGENPIGIPNNLMPFIIKVANNQIPFLPVYGNDYQTYDGTPIRDYVHVKDLAAGHLSAMKYALDNPGVNIWNLGSGLGFTVMDIVRTFQEVTSKQIKYKFVNRRDGDVKELVADITKAKNELMWTPSHDLSSMIYDAWHVK